MWNLGWQRWQFHSWTTQFVLLETHTHTHARKILELKLFFQLNGAKMGWNELKLDGKCFRQQVNSSNSEKQKNRVNETTMCRREINFHLNSPFINVKMSAAFIQGYIFNVPWIDFMFYPKMGAYYVRCTSQRKKNNENIFLNAKQRFKMWFKKGQCIEKENFNRQSIGIDGNIKMCDGNWKQIHLSCFNHSLKNTRIHSIKLAQNDREKKNKKKKGEKNQRFH